MVIFDFIEKEFSKNEKDKFLIMPIYKVELQ